jgi:hypothetical protein
VLIDGHSTADSKRLSLLCIVYMVNTGLLWQESFNKKGVLFTSILDVQLRKELVICYIWCLALYGAETWTLRAVDQKHLESIKMWCWRRMEQVSWTNHVRNEEALLKVKSRGLFNMK